MWHSALAAAGAMLQYHVLIGGLGGVITVVVGGIISAIALRSAKRAAVRPATNAKAAPTTHRPAPPASYGETAPPTSPARRLHPGPISLSKPPSAKTEEDETPPTSLFNPDLFSSDPIVSDETLAELAPTPPPVLRSHRSLAAEWRANAAPPPSLDLTHAPIWNRSPFARPDVSSAGSLAFDAAASEPPVWRVGSLSQRLSFASAPSDVAPAEAESCATPAPIWTSWLRPATAAEGGMAPEAAETPSAGTIGDEADPEPPIWPSFLRGD